MSRGSGGPGGDRRGSDDSAGEQQRGRDVPEGEQQRGLMILEGTGEDMKGLKESSRSAAEARKVLKEIGRGSKASGEIS